MNIPPHNEITPLVRLILDSPRRMVRLVIFMNSSGMGMDAESAEADHEIDLILSEG
ncbi:hypothetical protein [Peribacillus simplex]|uniref:hypothetical protein n=1 Tax=Peribacillus simplex TaxID=1478 RepID=UPI003D27FA53